MTLENVVWYLCLPCCPAGSDTVLCPGKHLAQLSEERLGFGSRVPLAARHCLENVAAALIDPSGLVLAMLLCLGLNRLLPQPGEPTIWVASSQLYGGDREDINPVGM